MTSRTFITAALVLSLAATALPVSAQGLNDRIPAFPEPAPAAHSMPRPLDLRDPALHMPLADARKLPASAAATAPKRAQRRVIVGTLIGVAIGAAAGIVTGASILLSDAQCQPHCGPRVGAGFAALIGFPILGGVIGHAIAK